MPRLNICIEPSDIQDYPKEDTDDYKPINYGWLNGKIVCVDYPYHKIKPYRR